MPWLRCSGDARLDLLVVEMKRMSTQTGLGPPLRSDWSKSLEADLPECGAVHAWMQQNRDR